MNWIKNFVSSATDVLRLWAANRKLRAQLDELDTHPAFEDIRNLDVENLKALAATEWQRSKDLDDKLAKLTAVLSVALTVSGVVTKMVADGMPSTPLGQIAVFLLFVAMAFFICGALVGFGGLRPKPKFGYGAGYLRIMAQGGVGAETELRGVVSSFQVANAIQANYGSAAIDLIRNGILAFAIGIAVSAFVPPVPATVDSPPVATGQSVVGSEAPPQESAVPFDAITSSPPEMAVDDNAVPESEVEPVTPEPTAQTP